MRASCPWARCGSGLAYSRILLKKNRKAVDFAGGKVLLSNIGGQIVGEGPCSSGHVGLTRASKRRLPSARM